VLDLVAAAILVRLLGWHWEFLPAFAAELVPGIDLVPFWTLAVAKYIANGSRSRSPRNKRATLKLSRASSSPLERFRAPHHGRATIDFNITPDQRVVWHCVGQQHSAAKVHDGRAGRNACELKLAARPVILDTTRFSLGGDQMHYSAMVAHDAELNPHANNYPTSPPNQILLVPALRLEFKNKPLCNASLNGAFLFGTKERHPAFQLGCQVRLRSDDVDGFARFAAQPGVQLLR
jgi:hypothetical protein